MIRLSGLDRARLALRATRSPRTVDRVYLGRGNQYSREAISTAAREMGLPLPPPPSTQSSDS